MTADSEFMPANGADEREWVSQSETRNAEPETRNLDPLAHEKHEKEKLTAKREERISED